MPYLSQLTDGEGRAVAGRDGHDPPPPQRRRAPRQAQASEGAGPPVLLRVDVVVLVVGRHLVFVQVFDRAAAAGARRVVALRGMFGCVGWVDEGDGDVGLACSGGSAPRLGGKEG